MKRLVGLVLLLGLGACMQAGPDGAVASEPGPIEIGFAQHMSQHHDQAVAMADLYLHGEGGELRGVASQIQRTQLLELGQMRGWLRLWDESLVPASRSMNWMLAGAAAPDKSLRAYLLDCERSSGGMPGLASVGEMRALATATGRQRERLFLQLMIAHHQGGLPMLDFVVREAKLPAVQELATRMLADQSREMVLLDTALQKLGPS